MNKKSIANAKNEALRGSEAAMKRAAENARKIAESTGTPLVVNRDGETVLVDPTDLDSDSANTRN